MKQPNKKIHTIETQAKLCFARVCRAGLNKPPGNRRALCFQLLVLGFSATPHELFLRAGGRGGPAFFHRLAATLLVPTPGV